MCYSLSSAQMKARRRDMQIIFQDPYSSSIRHAGRRHHRRGPARARHARPEGTREAVQYFLSVVGLRKEYVRRYPRFSGGQRQPIGVARALALRPKFIVCDEPVSALDVSVQSQVLNLLEDFAERVRLDYLFIAHDCRRRVSLGPRRRDVPRQMAELTTSEELYARPLTSLYQKRLLSAIPNPIRSCGASASFYRVTCRVRSIRRAAADSARVCPIAYEALHRREPAFREVCGT